MRKEDLFNLDLGTYHVTDGIYDYTLLSELTNDNIRCYRIFLTGSLMRTGIFLLEQIDDDDESSYKSLTCHAYIGGLSVHSDSTFDILSKLKFK